jgi:hypothetical protein
LFAGADAAFCHLQCSLSSRASARWSRLQVTDSKENTIEVRATMSADDAGRTFNLRCEVREKMIDFLQREHPEVLPRQRQVNFREAARQPPVTERPAAPAKPATKTRQASRPPLAPTPPPCVPVSGAGMVPSN